MFLSITTIPHEKQRYSTVDDYSTITSESGKEATLFNISETGNDDYNFLLIIHALVEWYLCKKAGISEKVIDEWDLSHPESKDPGALEGCPYHGQHETASLIEMECAYEMQVDCDDYESALEKLLEKEKPHEQTQK